MHISKICYKTSYGAMVQNTPFPMIKRHPTTSWATDLFNIEKVASRNTASYDVSLHVFNVHLFFPWAEYMSAHNAMHANAQCKKLVHA